MRPTVDRLFQSSRVRAPVIQSPAVAPTSAAARRRTRCADRVRLERKGAIKPENNHAIERTGAARHQSVCSGEEGVPANLRNVGAESVASGVALLADAPRSGTVCAFQG